MRTMMLSWNVVFLLLLFLASIHPLFHPSIYHYAASSYNQCYRFQQVGQAVEARSHRGSCSSSSVTSVPIFHFLSSSFCLFSSVAEQKKKEEKTLSQLLCQGDCTSFFTFPFHLLLSFFFSVCSPCC